MNRNNIALPDVMSQTDQAFKSQLKWVGMEKIALPIKFALNDVEKVAVTASVDIFVSLDAQVRGIHMSRLYLQLQQLLANQTLTFNRLNGLLEGVLHSQNNQSRKSNNAMVNIAFDLPIEKPALVTENTGFQAYALQINQQLVEGKCTTELKLTIPYSSTCPCSVSLTKELIGEAIEQQFNGETLNKVDLINWLTAKETALATPHNQRSYAYIDLVLAQHQWPDIVTLISKIEQAIGTPVQTAVKRTDEQAFAALNGEHLMFCEDAARKLTTYLDSMTMVADYRFKVEHQESLHAHNAVVLHQKS